MTTGISPMIFAATIVILMSEAREHRDEEVLNTSLQILPSHEASGMITDDPHTLPELASE